MVLEACDNSFKNRSLSIEDNNIHMAHLMCRYYIESVGQIEHSAFDDFLDSLDYLPIDRSIGKVWKTYTSVDGDDKFLHLYSQSVDTSANTLSINLDSCLFSLGVREKWLFTVKNADAKNLPITDEDLIYRNISRSVRLHRDKYINVNSQESWVPLVGEYGKTSVLVYSKNKLKDTSIIVLENHSKEELLDISSIIASTSFDGTTLESSDSFTVLYPVHYFPMNQLIKIDSSKK